MNKSGLLTIIAFVVLIFAIGKIAIQQLCSPTPNNVVARAVTESFASPRTDQHVSVTDPLSWEPIFHQLIGLISKACP